MIQIDNYPVTTTKTFGELALNDFFEVNGILYQKISMNNNSTCNALKYTADAEFAEASVFISAQVVIVKTPISFNIAITF